MVKEAVLVWQALFDEAQRGKRAHPRFAGGSETALVGDAKRRQPKTSRGDAGDFARVRPIRAAAVLDKAGLRIRRLAEETKAGPLQPIEKGVLGTGEDILAHRGEGYQQEDD